MNFLFSDDCGISNIGGLSKKKRLSLYLNQHPSAVLTYYIDMINYQETRFPSPYGKTNDVDLALTALEIVFLRKL
jgi:hypothetical protein